MEVKLQLASDTPIALSDRQSSDGITEVIPAEIVRVSSELQCAKAFRANRVAEDGSMADRRLKQSANNPVDSSSAEVKRMPSYDPPP
nr:hypothetical protein [Muribaculum intestinale]